MPAHDSPLIDFLQRLLGEGSVVLRERPVRNSREHPAAAAWLMNAYENSRLDVAGPLLPFDAALAVQAAECCRSACWFLVDCSSVDAEVLAEVKLPAPTTPAQHLSADLVLRFVPQIYHRARAVAIDDVLTVALAMLCRQWPLSGVLADIPEAPTTALDFGGHAGLQLLYAERFAEHQRTEWQPPGRAGEYVDLVLSERGEVR